jgi:hypothetical protein
MKKYSSGLISESFWFVEFRKFLKLRHEGKTWEEIRTLCCEDNLFGISKEYRAKRIFGYLKNRVEAIDDGLINIFHASDLSSQKIINLIAMMKQNSLFFEFVYEVYRDKVIIGNHQLTASDINLFFKNKQAQDDTITTWTDVTLKRLRSSYMNFLTDAGLLTLINKQKQITPPILDTTLERYLKETGDILLVKAMTGEN